MQTCEEWYLERGRKQGHAQGKAEGHAEARAHILIRLLARQGIHVDVPSRQRIMSCTDVATLDQWLDRALNATRLSDVFGDTAQ